MTQHQFVYADKPNHRTKHTKLGFATGKTLRRNNRTDVTDHIFVKAPEELIERHEANMARMIPNQDESTSV